MEGSRDGDSAAKGMGVPAAHSDDQPLPVNEYPESDVLDLTHYWIAQEMSPPLPDDYASADIRTLLHRLYALASQI
jgi:hypothetical protein